MCRLLLLGAGASIKAGYPATASLLDAVAEDAEASALVNYQDAWRAWRDYLDAAPPWLSLVLKNPNPEVALSLPDLFRLAVTAQDEHRFHHAVRQMEAGTDLHKELERYYEGEERSTLRLAHLAQLRLVDALNWFFIFRHGRDRDQPRQERDYLRRHLCRLAPNDVVVTTNWDPLAERVLAEDGRWSPTDGYGFPRTIEREAGYRRQPLPDGCLGSAQIPVLKLHGCFGWRHIEDRFFLQGADYLDQFGFHCDKHWVQLRDREEPETYSPSDPLVAFPSYLKPLSHPVFLEVWRRASRASLQCTQFAAAGYSLPESDSAVRALLLPLADAVGAGRTRAVVVDPAKSTLARWRAFLGPNATYIEAPLESAPELFEA